MLSIKPVGQVVKSESKQHLYKTTYVTMASAISCKMLALYMQMDLHVRATQNLNTWWFMCTFMCIFPLCPFVNLFRSLEPEKYFGIQTVWHRAIF